MFSTVGIATIGITTTAYTSIVFKNDTNSSKKTGSKNVIPKILGTKNSNYKKDLILEKEFSKKIKKEEKFLEQSFKNTPKTNNWKIFRRTKTILIAQSLSSKSEIDLKNEFKTGNLKIRALLYIQETPALWNKEQNQNYYSLQTKKWSDQIAKKLTNLLRIEQSSFSPFVNFIFKDFNDKEKNLDILQNEKRIKVVFSYENLEVKKTKPNRIITLEECEWLCAERKAGITKATWMWASKSHREQWHRERLLREKANRAAQEKKSIFESIFKDAKLDTQLNEDRYNYDSLDRMKIGILESPSGNDRSAAFVNESLSTFDRTTIINKKSSNDKFSKHTSLVAAIAAGENGVNIKAKIYSANVYYGLQSAIEWMMNNGVKIINHSYGPSSGIAPYSENSYYIDFISRKYGMINVYTTGNEGNLPQLVDGETYPKINGEALSINSIVVGGLNHDSTWKSSFSNFGISNKDNDFLDKLPKPLVSTNSVYFKNSIVPGFTNKYEHGTSYSAPIVTGALSLIMRDFQDVDRPEEAMAIIASSSTKLFDPHNNPYRTYEWEGKGFDKYVGAGRFNFVNLKKAANNLRSYTIAKNDSNIVHSEQIFLDKGDKITASVAWLYNAGFSMYYNTKPSFFNSWWYGKLKILVHLFKDVRWITQNNSEDWKSKKIAFDDLKNLRLFTDYDIKLKRYDQATRTWNKVAYSSSSYSNVELFRYKVRNSGKYKLEVVKYSRNNESYRGAPDDALAVSYVIKE